MTTTIRQWTMTEFLARRASGWEPLCAANGWAVSSTGAGSYGGTVKVSIAKCEPRTYKIVERDPRDGEIFPSQDEADLYALNRGALVWYNDWKAARGGAS